MIMITIILYLVLIHLCTGECHTGHPQQPADQEGQTNRAGRRTGSDKRHTQGVGMGACVSLICTKKINTYKTATLGSFTYVHSDLEFNELSSGSSSIITASVIILVVGFP